MAKSLIQIQNRIKLIKNIEKITNALKLTSSAKMKRLMKDFRTYRSYIEDVYHSLDLLSFDVKPNDEGISVVFIVTSEIGLCGSYNTRVIKLLNTFLEKKQNKIVMYHVGRKMKTKLKSFNPAHVDISPGHNIHSESTLKEIEKICNSLHEQIAKNEICNIIVIGHKFVNQLIQKPFIYEIFPFVGESEIASSVLQATEYIPDKNKLADELTPFYLSSAIRAAIFESFLSIEAMRNVAMDAATTNANELLEKLVLEHNRARQAKVTQEIIEIVSGAEGD